MTGFCLDARPRCLVSFYGYGDIVGPWYSEPDPFYCKQPMVTKEDAFKAVGTQPISEGTDKNRFTFYLYCRQNGLWPDQVSGFDPNREPRAFDRYCPIRNITKDYPPTLLLHGDLDTDVPHQQSVDMSVALAQAGVDHEFISVPGGGHGFDGKVKPEHLDGPAQTFAARSLLRTVAFLSGHLDRA